MPVPTEKLRCLVDRLDDVVRRRQTGVVGEGIVVEFVRAAEVHEVAGLLREAVLDAEREELRG